MPFPKVALIIETSNAYARGLLRGVHSWVRENKPWSIYLAEQGRGEEPPAWLKTWQGDGIIARIENPAIANVISSLGIPTVDMSAARLLRQLSCFEIDEAGIGLMAAEHLAERGFKHFAYCGDARFVWSKLRGDAYAKALTAMGHKVHEYEAPPGNSQAGDDEMLSIRDWLLSLPRPVAVFCCYDIRGRLVLDTCRSFSIPVPDRVAVLGVDNDELLCALAFPPLSSVIPNAQRTGYEAAALLARMMSGEKTDAEHHLIAPIGVVTRQSTDVLAVDDAHVAQAVQFIREYACQGICVDDVAKDSGISRRALEAKFKKLLSRSPHEEIMRVQIIRVKELLADTDLPLLEVARRAGFRYVEYLSAVFKQKAGIPPGKYRLAHQPNRKVRR